MFNRAIMLGNLTRDCELRYLPNGSAVCTTGIATNRKFKKQDGSQGEEVCFIDITFFGRTAEVANQYLHKGKKLMIEGRLKLDQWTDDKGVKRSKHSIVVESMQMLDGAKSEEHSEPSEAQERPKEQKQYQGHDIPDIDINDDEIPF